MHAFVVHDETLALEQDVQPPVAEACAHRRVRVQPGQYRDIGRTGASLVSPRRRDEPDDSTGSTETRAARLQPPHHLAPSDGAYHFFATTALSAWMSSIC